MVTSGKVTGSGVSVPESSDFPQDVKSTQQKRADASNLNFNSGITEKVFVFNVNLQQNKDKMEEFFTPPFISYIYSAKFISHEFNLLVLI
jgi:hypothetical protein